MDWDILSLLSFTENLELLWLFGVGFKEKSLSVFKLQLFWKKKQVFNACQNVAFLRVSVNFGNIPNFAGLWYQNHLTHRDSWGIIGKIMYVAFIWYLVWPLVCSQLHLEKVASSYHPSKYSFQSWVIKLSLILHSEICYSLRSALCKKIEPKGFRPSLEFVSQSSCHPNAAISWMK